MHDMRSEHFVPNPDGALPLPLALACSLAHAADGMGPASAPIHRLRDPSACPSACLPLCITSVQSGGQIHEFSDSQFGKLSPSFSVLRASWGPSALVSILLLGGISAGRRAKEFLHCFLFDQWSVVHN